MTSQGPSGQHEDERLVMYRNGDEISLGVYKDPNGIYRFGMYRNVYLKYRTQNGTRTEIVKVPVENWRKQSLVVRALQKPVNPP